MQKIFAGIISALFLFASSYALASDKNIVKVTEAWAKPPLGTRPVGAAYLTLENTGKEEVSLVKATSPTVAEVEIHTMSMEGNIARMRKLSQVEVAPGQKVALEPGGIHMMLMGIKEPLKAGGHFPLTLVFDKNPPVTVDVEVR